MEIKENSQVHSLGKNLYQSLQSQLKCGRSWVFEKADKLLFHHEDFQTKIDYYGSTEIDGNGREQTIMLRERIYLFSAYSKKALEGLEGFKRKRFEGNILPNDASFQMKNLLSDLCFIISTEIGY
ncbi:hypothetical protein AVEN_134425-1 [Araneus ventricosus]|uniref:Uncharacterized protein n=1 Tax=Araneus ventricosus TaxID=182803 RepID=A0A4Y2HVV1_ARAVE|nr:hypothetical protein AVEN_134425-1 [Araneus ventricosus]